MSKQFPRTCFQMERPTDKREFLKISYNQYGQYYEIRARGFAQQPGDEDQSVQLDIMNCKKRRVGVSASISWSEWDALVAHVEASRPDSAKARGQ